MFESEIISIQYSRLRTQARKTVIPGMNQFQKSPETTASSLPTLDPFRKPAVPRASVTKNPDNKPHVQFGGVARHPIARHSTLEQRTSFITASPTPTPATAGQQIDLQNRTDLQHHSKQEAAAQKRASILNDLGDFKNMFGATQRQITSEHEQKEIQFPIGKAVSAMSMRKTLVATTNDQQTAAARAAVSKSKVNVAPVANANVTHADKRASSNNLIERNSGKVIQGLTRRHTVPNGSLTATERKQADILQRNERNKSLTGSYYRTHSHAQSIAGRYFTCFIKNQSISIEFQFS